MIDPYAMNETQFKTALAERTTPQAIFENAPRIYDYMTELFGTNCGDSVLREWAFQWWTETAGYDVIYNKWLSGSKFYSPS